MLGERCCINARRGAVIRMFATFCLLERYCTSTLTPLLLARVTYTCRRISSMYSQCLFHSYIQGTSKSIASCPNQNLAVEGS